MKCVGRSMWTEGVYKAMLERETLGVRNAVANIAHDVLRQHLQSKDIAQLLYRSAALSPGNMNMNNAYKIRSITLINKCKAVV